MFVAILKLSGLTGIAMAAVFLVRASMLRRMFKAIARSIVMGVRSQLARRRALLLEGQLPGCLLVIASALRAGCALPHAIAMAAQGTLPPLQTDLARIVADVKLGTTVEAALESWAKRVPSNEVQLVARSVEVLRRSGGNLIRTFELLAQTIESRRRVAERIDVLSAQGRSQARILLAMPWILAAALAVVAPEYLTPIVSTSQGHGAIALMILLQIVGILWFHRITTIHP